MIRLFILADIRIYRDGLAEILARRGGIKVVGTAADLGSALAAISATRPEIALVDVAMPDGIAAVRSVLRAAPEVKVVALAVPDAEVNVIACAEAGVSGYVTRDESLDDVVEALESVTRGEMLCSPRMAATLLRRVTALAAGETGGARSRLTARELEIVELIDQGLSNKEIASRLFIELATVKNHVHNILEKLQVQRRSDAAAHLRAHTTA
jgi:two-component system, NarL family, nitrate/nitrite response regulator NarL